MMEVYVYRGYLSVAFKGLFFWVYVCERYGKPPENKHGTWKWTPGQVDSYWKSSVSDSMLDFQGVGFAEGQILTSSKSLSILYFWQC